MAKVVIFNERMSKEKEQRPMDEFKKQVQGADKPKIVSADFYDKWMAVVGDALPKDAPPASITEVKKKRMGLSAAEINQEIDELKKRIEVEAQKQADRKLEDHTKSES
jgi:hypothetical protein